MNTRHCYWIGLVCCALSPLFAHAQDLGWIDGIEGDANAATLIRQGKSVPLRPYVQLLAGDQIVITSTRTAVLLNTAEGTTQRITTERSPFSIRPTGSTPTVSGNILKWVSGLFAGDQNKNAPQALSAMSTRGADAPPLSVPYLSKRFMLLAGKRPLYLSWSGGTAPYRVKLIRLSDMKDVFDVGEIRERSTITPTSELVEGEYLLEIIDATQTAYEESIRVVAPTRQPAFPDPQALAQLPENSARLVKASWLGSTENGRWVIEAMQQLHALAVSTPTAASVLQRVEQGAVVE